jgi:hypothetical protein
MSPNTPIPRCLRRTIAVGAVVAVVAVLLASPAAIRIALRSSATQPAPTSTVTDRASVTQDLSGARVSGARHLELAALVATPWPRRLDAVGPEGDTASHRPGQHLHVHVTSTFGSTERIVSSSRGPPSTSVH